MQQFSFMTINLKCCLQNVSHFVPTSTCSQDPCGNLPLWKPWKRLHLPLAVHMAQTHHLKQHKKLGKIFTGPTYKLLLSFTVISNFNRSFIPNKITFTKYPLTQCILTLHGSSEIHWVGQYLVNFTGVAGILNITVYKTEPIFTGLGHGELS